MSNMPTSLAPKMLAQYVSRARNCEATKMIGDDIYVFEERGWKTTIIGPLNVAVGHTIRVPIIPGK